MKSNDLQQGVNGQAIFLQTDTPSIEEVVVPFLDLAELVKVCCTPRPNLVLERVEIEASSDGQSRSVTLDFRSSSLAQIALSGAS